MDDCQHWYLRGGDSHGAVVQGLHELGMSRLQARVKIVESFAAQMRGRNPQVKIVESFVALEAGRNS